MKNSGENERINQMEDQISKYRETKQNTKGKSEETIWELSDTTRKGNIKIIGTTQEERNKNLLKEIMEENFPNMKKE